MPDGPQPAADLEPIQPAVVLEGDQVCILFDPVPALPWQHRRNRPTGQIQVHGPGHVEAVAVDEQAERTAEPGIDIQHLVRVVATVIAKSDIDEPAVSEL